MSHHGFCLFPLTILVRYSVLLILGRPMDSADGDLRYHAVHYPLNARFDNTMPFPFNHSRADGLQISRKVRYRQTYLMLIMTSHGLEIHHHFPCEFRVPSRKHVSNRILRTKIVLKPERPNIIIGTRCLDSRNLAVSQTLFRAA